VDLSCISFANLPLDLAWIYASLSFASEEIYCDLFGDNILIPFILP